MSLKEESDKRATLGFPPGPGPFEEESRGWDWGTGGGNRDDSGGSGVIGLLLKGFIVLMFGAIGVAFALIISIAKLFFGGGRRR